MKNTIKDVLIRKIADITNSKAYKKLYYSYDICNYVFISVSEEEILDLWYDNNEVSKHDRFKAIHN